MFSGRSLIYIMNEVVRIENLVALLSRTYWFCRIHYGETTIWLTTRTNILKFIQFELLWEAFESFFEVQIKRSCCLIGWSNCHNMIILDVGMHEVD